MEEQEREGLQRVLRGVSEGLAEMPTDSRFTRLIEDFRLGLIEALVVMTPPISPDSPPPSAG